MLPTLERVAPGAVKQSELITGAEDFSYFQRQALPTGVRALVHLTVDYMTGAGTGRERVRP